MGGKHAQTPTTAADRQPDGKRGRLKIDLGPSLADASEGADGPSGGRVRLERRSRGGKSHDERLSAKAQNAAARAAHAGSYPAA